MAKSRKKGASKGFLKPHIDAYTAVVKKFTVFKGRARRRDAKSSTALSRVS